MKVIRNTDELASVHNALAVASQVQSKLGTGDLSVRAFCIWSTKANVVVGYTFTTNVQQTTIGAYTDGNEWHGKMDFHGQARDATTKKLIALGARRLRAYRLNEYRNEWMFSHSDSIGG